MKKISTPSAPAAAVTAAAALPSPPVGEHLRNPTLARALFAVWGGDPAVVIDSPPGAGKTHLITHLAHQLHARAGMTVAIAAQTRAQARDVANRTAATGAPTVLHQDHNTPRPHDLSPAVERVGRAGINPGAGIVVGTTARWIWTPEYRPVHFDVMLIDEAYQLTFADLGALGSVADQFVLVGDPGQISPVVTGSTRRWETWASGPHVPAPEALIATHGDHVTRLRLPQTWRLGPDTTDLIAPLYPALPFTSARPPRHIAVAGSRLPEFEAVPITITAGTADPRIASTIDQHVRALLAGGSVHTSDGARPLDPADVAVIAPHVEQAALAAAALADLPDVFVGTINQAQGLQREAVVAVHPLLGHDPEESFARDLGRLCVALSRHQAHARVITDDRTPALLTAAIRQHADTRALPIQAQILDGLLTG